MACIINASTSNGLVNSADGSGIVKLQSNGVATNALAWVNFNGTGTVAIRSSYNVSSITDNGTGDYTVNFATALSDANYAVTGIGCTSAGNSWGSISLATAIQSGTDPTTSLFRVKTTNSNATTLIDVPFVNLIVHGN